MSTNGPHHKEVRLGQVFIERETVFPRSLLTPLSSGVGGRDPLRKLLLVLEAHRPKLTVVEPGYYRLVLACLARQDVGLLDELLLSWDVGDGTSLHGPIEQGQQDEVIELVRYSTVVALFLVCEGHVQHSDAALSCILLQFIEAVVEVMNLTILGGQGRPQLPVFCSDLLHVLLHSVELLELACDER